MMNAMMDAALQNLNMMADLQAKTEEQLSQMMNQAAKNRQESLKATQKMVDLTKKQSKATEAYINEMMDVAQKMMVPAKA